MENIEPTYIGVRGPHDGIGRVLDFMKLIPCQ
jgi:hypothetical protein